MEASVQMRAIKGTLKRHPVNPRYFTDDGKRAVYLTGSHTWANLQDIFLVGSTDGLFDYDTYLHMLEVHNHNFFRLWMFENAAWAAWTRDKIIFTPLPYVRTGPGTALDGEPKFDLDQWNEEYFRRLRNRVIQAGERGIFVSVMLFEGWSANKPVMEMGGKSWNGNPFNKANNINGVDGEVEDRDGLDAYSLKIPAITTYQEAYVRKVIDTVNDLDNVLYEITNELAPTEATCKWQYHIINTIHTYEASLPKQHPVGMTIPWDGIGKQDNTVLFDSPADWISPFAPEGEDYKENPPEGDGRKVVITDTDHLWGIGGNYRWVWKSFLRGLNPIFMDPWHPNPGKPLTEGDASAELNRRDYPDWEPIRSNMGYTLQYAQKMDLAEMKPYGSLASSGYCLANPGYEYLVFLPESREVELDFGEARQEYTVEWFDPCTGMTSAAGEVTGSGRTKLISPFEKESILYLHRKECMGSILSWQ